MVPPFHVAGTERRKSSSDGGKGSWICRSGRLVTAQKAKMALIYTKPLYIIYGKNCGLVPHQTDDEKLKWHLV